MGRSDTYMDPEGTSIRSLFKTGFDLDFLEMMEKEPLFLSLSGSHIYGLADEDSDFDVRGCHVEPPSALLSMRAPYQTYVTTFDIDGKKYDITTHELGKFLTLMHKSNGTIIEQVMSPVPLFEGKHYRELTGLAKKCMTRKLYYHYRDFTLNMLRRMRDDAKKRHRKDVNYAFRTALTGTFVLDNGRIECNLNTLLDYYDVKIDRAHPSEQIALLLVELRNAFERSTLPEEPACYDEMNGFLLKVRGIG